jgi:hypothetical protein
MVEYSEALHLTVLTMNHLATLKGLIMNSCRSLMTSHNTMNHLATLKAAGSEVFTREYSKATVQMDCKAWKGSITMK